jgi:hypothetical protein
VKAAKLERFFKYLYHSKTDELEMDRAKKLVGGDYQRKY